MNPPDLDLPRFRAVQQLAYRCVEEVGRELEAGVTEREAARRIAQWLEANGVDDWFHRPFAWFGDRTAFRGRWHPLKFFPTDRRLEHGMPFILDVAPVRGGVAADVGYASSLGPNAILEKLLEDLALYRSSILKWVQERVPFGEISRRVDALALKHGYDVRHRAYPLGVLAHRVDPLPAAPGGTTFAGFGVRSLGSLGRQALAGRREGWSPFWNVRSDHPPIPGLWAVEPHLGFRDVGAKFEELLWVTEEGAQWLDDDLPHVRRWSKGKAVAA